MCGCSMALRYDDRGSNFSKPYYNGKGGGNSGKDRNWNNNNSGDGGGRFGSSGGGGGEFRETSSSAAEHHSRKHERRDAITTSRSHENWGDDRSNAGDSDKAQLKQVGDWTEQLSSAGKKYYYNCRTEISQWEKPAEWVASEKRSGAQEQNRKRRGDRPAADELNSPSHSSAGRPSSSRDQNQSSQRRGGGYEDGGAFFENAGGRNYGNHVRRPHPNNSGGTNRGGDYSRGSRSKYDARGGGQFSANRSSFDASQSRYDQQTHASSSGGDHRERSKRQSNNAPTTSRDVDGDEFATRERSPKRSRFAPAEQGNVDRSGPDKRTAERSMLNATSAMECDDEDVTANVKIDMERLPHLLVEIAEKNNIDLSDPDALEKIKRHLKSALCKELSTGTPKNGGSNCHLAAVSDDDEDIMKLAEQHFASGAEGRKEFVDEEEQAQPTDPATAITQASMGSLFNEELVAHIRGWSARHFEDQAAHLANTSFHISLDVSHISADLKCARSLVRTAEIRSTLLEQRIAYLRQQHHELETMSKPNAAAAISASMASS